MTDAICVLVGQGHLPVVLLGDALVVAPLVAQPLLVELAPLIFVSDTAHTVPVVLAGFWRLRCVLEFTLCKVSSLDKEIAGLVPWKLNLSEVDMVADTI